MQHKRYLRQLRTKFHPIICNIFAANVIRGEMPQGEVLKLGSGYGAHAKDGDLVNHRSNFILELANFNEIPEVRVLRKPLIESMFEDSDRDGLHSTINLAREAKSINVCLTTVEKALEL